MFSNFAVMRARSSFYAYTFGFRQLQVPVAFEEVKVGDGIETEDLDLVLESIKRNRVALKGNLETHKYREGFFSKNHYIRERLDLFASVTRCHSVLGVPTRLGFIRVAAQEILDVRRFY